MFIANQKQFRPEELSRVEMNTYYFLRPETSLVSRTKMADIEKVPLCRSVQGCRLYRVCLYRRYQPKFQALPRSPKIAFLSTIFLPLSTPKEQGSYIELLYSCIAFRAIIKKEKGVFLMFSMKRHTACCT